LLGSLKANSLLKIKLPEPERMDSLKGAKLLKADGSSVEVDNALQGKV